MHVVVMQCAGIGSGQKFGIDDTGVGIERNIFRQAVVVDAGDQRTLFVYGGFFLDDRCHGDGKLHGGHRC